MAWMTICCVLLILISHFQHSTSSHSFEKRVRSDSRNGKYPQAKTCKQDFRKQIATCRHSRLTTVPSDLFPNIHTLDLSDNQITRLLNDSFQNYVQLQVLDVSSNRIRFVDVGTLYSLPFLTRLNLGFNGDLVLPNSELFVHSVHLSTLILKYCGISYIPTDFFKHLISLHELNLDGNSLSSLHMLTCGSKSMGRIRLQGNDIRLTLGNFTLRCNTDVLVLSYNYLCTVDVDTIASLPIRRLELTNFFDYSRNTTNTLFRGLARSAIKELSILSMLFPTTYYVEFFIPLHNYSLEVLEIDCVGKFYHIWMLCF